ncbi:hypothetical protein OAF27_00880 [Verrucomicrobiales bacterium]|nr:hypothetical protein [Verrucomicrobiales bacterium]
MARIMEIRASVQPFCHPYDLAGKYCSFRYNEFWNFFYTIASHTLCLGAMSRIGIETNNKLNRKFMKPTLILALASTLAVPQLHAEPAAEPEAVVSKSVKPALNGYSPVSLYNKGRDVAGSPNFAVEHKGLTFFLVDAKEMEEFKKDPEKYIPAFGGDCTKALSGGKHLPGSASCSKKIDGKIYLFSSDAALLTWNKGDETEQLEAAKTNYTEKLKGARNGK